MKQLVILYCFTFALETTALVCYQSVSQDYTTNCGLLGWSRCRRTRYSSRAICCNGWSGSVNENCNKALCNGEPNPNGCNREEGNVKVGASGQTYTSSGGDCFEPDTCKDCNPGYYANGSYCRACTELPNCHYANCTDPSTSVCQYCEGVIKDDPTHYGWWAYTRWVDGGLSCKLACSWRAGSRCYPGTCSDTTVASCQCTYGFGGRDCASITEQPPIIGSFVKLKHETQDSHEFVDAPRDITAPPPQDIVYTNNVYLASAEAYVEAQYKKVLPTSPDDFYVKHDDSSVGIVNGGVELSLFRGSSNLGTVSTNCPTDSPQPTNYRCDGIFSLENSWSDNFPFQDGDRIELKTFATNGGFITVYDREDNNKEVKYNITGKTKTYTFDIGIDTGMPKHCKLLTSCEMSPLDVTEISVHPTVPVKWQGWYDERSGMDSYHFEVFHLQSTGSEETSKLKHGDKVNGAINASVSFNVAEAAMTLPSAGPYSITIAAFDKAGNHRTARRVLIFDDQSKVDTQGIRTVMAGKNGRCVWKEEPAAPIIYNANPNANCDWIVEFGPITIYWKDYFINTRHHAGHWLHAVTLLDYVELELDDNEGRRQIQGMDNVLGIVNFNVSYKVIFQGKTTPNSWQSIPDIHAQSTSITTVLQDGMALNITIRAIDIYDAYSDESVFIKIDSSQPVIEDLWLTDGSMRNLSVHKVEDLSMLTIEWETEDVESGIDTVKWRIFDNYTGEDLLHGSSFESPQGNTATILECKSKYGSYSRGSDCYCTPFDGCFHRHFQVKPAISNDGMSGLAADRHIGTHNYDYYIEVTVHNRAMLKTVRVKKITIDISPPVPGIVQEGISGSAEIDFQQDRHIHVHWKDFFDPESGVIFYDYIYGIRCYDDSVFTSKLGDADQIKRTYLDFASFTIPSDGTYYTTVVAYNRALDRSLPVCSDGVTIDSTLPSVSRVRVSGAITESGLISTDNDEIWYLHTDKTIQLVDTPHESCKPKAMYLSHSQIILFPIHTDSQGRNLSLQKLNCEKETLKSEIISYIPELGRLDVTWISNNVYSTSIGIASLESHVPDVVGFESTYHQTNVLLNDINLGDGQFFDLLIQTVSRSGTANTQRIGPFLIVSSPPSFRGELTVSAGLDESTLIVAWPEDAFVDKHAIGGLKYEFAVGTQFGGTDIQAYRGIYVVEKCHQSRTPNCIVINIASLKKTFHNLHEYYVTIKATNNVGLSVTAVSPPYTRDVLKPTTGVVLDVNGNENLQVRQDAAFQLNATELAGEWFGFESSNRRIDYTLCQVKDEAIDKTTCNNVWQNTSGTVTALKLDYFTVYKLAVIACSLGGCVNVFSNGIMPIDVSLELEDIVLRIGPDCEKKNTVISDDQYSHHEQIFMDRCSTDPTYQISLNVLSTNWIIPDKYEPFITDVYWSVQQRILRTDNWERITEEDHVFPFDTAISTNSVLVSGRTYRFELKFCASEFCFPNLYTFGVNVVHKPPIGGTIDVVYDQTGDGTKLKVSLEKFMDPDIVNPSEAREALSHYEWAIVDYDHPGRILHGWKTVNNIVQTDQQKFSFEIQIPVDIQITKCWRISVRGYNRVGLYSTISKDVHECQDKGDVREPTVLDCVGQSKHAGDGSVIGEDIHYIQNTFWSEKDKDYTPHDNIISAVWPSLRYLMYEYAVLEGSTIDFILFHEATVLDLRRPCDNPGTVQCGITSANFVNVHQNLIHGRRYSVCVHANKTTLKYEKWEEELPEINVCSDGITIDLTAPTPGSVYLNGEKSIYQQSLTEILVTWQSFVDVEEQGNAVHSTGITHYELAIGTRKGGTDVHDWVNVNITNHYIVHNLTLQNGYRYYATVKGYDFTGKNALAYSDPITIDTTPPELSNREISTGTRYISHVNNIHMCWWDLFSDYESGIHYYEYAVGTRSGYDDTYSWTKTTEQCISVLNENEKMRVFEEGLTYVLSVKAYNGAGLFTTSSSWAIIVDYSPPAEGTVFDGTKEHGRDVNYQTYTHNLSAFWSGFHDPHTHIEQFYLAVGTEPNADDSVAKHAVGIRDEIEFTGLHLKEGLIYYITVTACNTAELCSSVSSDGILIDSSPPVPGLVKDGSGIYDIEFQSSRKYLASKWSHFVDSQSGLSHYTWRVGTYAGASDVMTTTMVYLEDNIVMPDSARLTGQALPVGIRLYSSVRAYNKAGLWSESTSNGFVVDDTPPVFVSSLAQSSIGSLRESTSVLPNMLRVTWEVEDEDSFIDKNYLSLVSHIGEGLTVTLQLSGHLRDYTFTDINLHDGTSYDVILWSCNTAELCSSSSLSGILVDSSAPTAGTFAIHTDHAANLYGEIERMTWSEDTINVTLVGFSDEHSGISNYQFNVGSSYMNSDLNLGTLSVKHDEDTFHLSDDGGLVKVFTIPTTDLSQNRHVYITVWAENGVGLRSDFVHSQFKLKPGGDIELVRRCLSYSCQGHCECAAKNKKCPKDSSTPTCVDVTASSEYTDIRVKDVVYLQENINITHTSTNAMMAAKWEVSDSSIIQPEWYEWSVGLADESEPQGVFSNVNMWNDAAQIREFVFTLASDNTLHEKEKYIVFVRAWYDASHFATFKSPGVVISSKKPKMSKLFGRTVKEMDDTNGMEIDFIQETDSLFLNWTGVFIDTSGILMKYNVFLSTTPTGRMSRIMNDVPATTTRIQIFLSDLNIQPGVRYYSTVQAFTLSGLHASAVSDGFVIDMDIPIAGVVLDGSNMHDLIYQNQSQTISAHWHGFVDIHSSITSYTWCISTVGNEGVCDIIPETDMGMQTHVEQYLPIGIGNGQMLISEVKATAAAGHTSDKAKSNGVVLDTTAPEVLHLQEKGDNLIHNPSFEQTNFTIPIDDFKLRKACVIKAIRSWYSSGCTVILTDILKGGNTALWMRGNISQDLTSIKQGHTYSLIFHVSHFPSSIDNAALTEEVFALFGNDHHVFKIHARPGHTQSKTMTSWQMISGTFVAEFDTAVLTIGTMPSSNGILIDDIVLTELDEVIDSSDGNVTVHAVLLHDWTSIHAMWKCKDLESGIKGYMWAIGTVRGGTQLQNFKSVGKREFDANTNLKLPHQTELYVTVIATNGADLDTVIYSDPLLIDRTAPIILAVNDGPNEGEDVDFQANMDISFTFDVEDLESDIRECLWSLGSVNDYDSAIGFTKLQRNVKAGGGVVAEHVDTSRPLFVTIRCVNSVGLATVMRSDGVQILLRSPDTRNVVLDILGRSETQYPVKDFFHGRTDELNLRWSGFKAEDHIKFYRVDVHGENFAKSYKIINSESINKFVKLDGLDVSQGNYSCSLTGINEIGVHGDTIVRNVTILRDKPAVADVNGITMTLDSEMEVVTIDWHGVFDSQYNLYYEVSVGTAANSADVILWQETVSTNIKSAFTTSSLGEFGIDIFVVVTAISPSGTFTTVSTSQLITKETTSPFT